MNNINHCKSSGFLIKTVYYRSNTCASFAQNSAGVLEITDTNNYYPLGLNHTGGNGINLSKFGSYNSYKFNGKEIQENGMFDYGARFYMPDLGRWGVVDPLAEQMRRHSPYNYAFNNPVNFVDPDGRQPYNPRNFYGEHSAFSGNFDSNSTLLYGTGSFGYTNFAALSFASGEQGGGGMSYYGQEAYNVLQNFLNPQYNFSQFNFSGPPNEYIVEMKTGQVRQISDLGGDEIDFFHYEGGKFNGKTRIVDRESGDDQWMNSSKNLKGYTRRMNSTGWAALFDEFLRGGGPENSLLVGKENVAVNQLMDTDMYKSAISYFKGTTMNEKTSYSGMFGLIGVVAENKNMQGQFMGKTNFSFYPVGNKVVIMAFDSKSISSYSLNIFNKSESRNIPRINGVGIPQSTTKQTYLLWVSKNSMLKK